MAALELSLLFIQAKFNYRDKKGEILAAGRSFSLIAAGRLSGLEGLEPPTRSTSSIPAAQISPALWKPLMSCSLAGPLTSRQRPKPGIS